MSVGRNAAWVAFEDESIVRLAALRKNVERLALVPGDLVRATALDDGRVLVDAREARSFSLERTIASGRVKTMAANVDGIAIVAAFARPPLQLSMVDELFAFAEIHGIAARAIFTKPDLAAAAEVDAAAIAALYASLGYATFTANLKTASGVDAIARALEDAHTLLIGQSGVGKSSLFRSLGGSGAIGDVAQSGRGKQTTMTGRLARLGNGFLIDSPGVGEFALTGCSAAEVARGFVEFAPFAPRCRFADCRHGSEPACAVRLAADAGVIAASRYANYLAICRRNPGNVSDLRR